jgi:hypothetical protein
MHGIAHGARSAAAAHRPDSQRRDAATTPRPTSFPRFTMKCMHSMLGAALWLVAGVAAATLPPLQADSAALDRADIPALMLSNGKDPAKATAAQDAYEIAWKQFAAKQRSVYAGDAGWTKTLASAEAANAQARAALSAGRLTDAHNAQEEVRHALWHQRQAMGVAYLPDALTNFHATMELIIATAQGKAPAEIGAADVATLRTKLAQARAQWQAVTDSRWNTTDYGLEGPRLDTYRAALAAESQALDAFAAALDSGDGARIAKAATAIKPPFAKAYSAFGVFPQ